jgi:hypothetical protein
MYLSSSDWWVEEGMKNDWRRRMGFNDDPLGNAEAET